MAAEEVINFTKKSKLIEYWGKIRQIPNTLEASHDDTFAVAGDYVVRYGTHTEDPNSHVFKLLKLKADAYESVRWKRPQQTGLDVGIQ